MNNGYSFTKFSLSVPWQRILTQELLSPSRYHCTTAHIKSSIHTVSLHRPTCNSSSTTNFPWLTPNENWLTRSADSLQDKSSARTARKTPSSFFKDACLQFRCLAIDVLLFRAFAWRGPNRKQFPLNFCHVLKGGCLLPSHRNGSSSIVACIRCRENVYGHSSVVIET
jgi:hypothetical protein